MSNGDKIFGLELGIRGKAIKDNDITKVVLYNNSKKITINSTKISNVSFDWGVTYVEILKIDVPNDTHTLKDLDALKEILSSDEDVFVKCSSKKSKDKTYKLNRYQIETFRANLRYFEEAMTYVSVQGEE